MAGGGGRLEGKGECSPGSEGRGGVPAAASHVQVWLRTWPVVVVSNLALHDAWAEGDLQRPVADHVPVGRLQAVEVVNVELPGDVTAQEFHLLWARAAVNSRRDSRGPAQQRPLARPLPQPSPLLQRKGRPRPALYSSSACEVAPP